MRQRSNLFEKVRKNSKLVWLQFRLFARRLPWIRITLIVNFLLFFFRNVPNPFSSDYEKLLPNQQIDWRDVDDVLKMKNQILKNDSWKIRTTRIEIESMSNPMVILLYTNVFLNRKYCHFSVDRIFGPTCPSKDRCRWSCDRRELSIADAIIVHAYDVQYHRNSLPTRSKCKRNAIWILWSDEPPSIVDYSIFNSHFFNWTISYKLKSEVSIGTYGLISKRARILTNDEFTEWRNKEFYERTLGAVWFVSNCDAKERLDIFYQLKQLSTLVIEGYGRCVDHYPVHWCQRYTRCEQQYMSMFKFYLSFESMTCEDYVTEKFYKALHYGLIPIVYGPKRQDYERVAPKNSFIHLDDYERNLTRLAAALQRISSDRDSFSEFHSWRKTRQVIIDPRALDTIRMCELCERLNRIDFAENSYYSNIQRFYNQGC